MEKVETARHNRILTEIKNLRKDFLKLSEEVGRIDADLNRDRGDLGDLKVEMSAMKSEIKQLRGELNANADKVKNKVSDVLEPAREEMANLQKEIKGKTTLKIFKNGFIDWFINKFGGDIYGTGKSK